tara:strand:- start:338 stop:589 length:252 start_codon:yes stop_codon:yes gene_type:complete
MYLTIKMQSIDVKSKSDFTGIQTDRVETQKPQPDLNKIKHPVDINVLKSRLREKENIILKKNIFILVSCITLIIVAGISVTYL